MLQRVTGAVRDALVRRQELLKSLSPQSLTALEVVSNASTTAPVNPVSGTVKMRTVMTTSTSKRKTVAPTRWRQLGWLGGLTGARGVSAPSIDTSDVNDSGLIASDALPYKLSVVTGDVRGAGSTTPVVVTLYGDDDSCSESHVIGGEENQAFERATKSQYVLYSKSLGRLRRIVIEQLPGKRGRSDSDTAWYLDRIEVHCPDGHRYAFPCSSWFGKDRKKKNLLVAEEDKDTQRS